MSEQSQEIFAKGAGAGPASPSLTSLSSRANAAPASLGVWYPASTGQVEFLHQHGAFLIPWSVHEDGKPERPAMRGWSRMRSRPRPETLLSMRGGAAFGPEQAPQMMLSVRPQSLGVIVIDVDQGDSAAIEEIQQPLAKVQSRQLGHWHLLYLDSPGIRSLFESEEAKERRREFLGTACDLKYEHLVMLYRPQAWCDAVKARLAGAGQPLCQELLDYFILDRKGEVLPSGRKSMKNTGVIMQMLSLGLDPQRPEDLVAYLQRPEHKANRQRHRNHVSLQWYLSRNLGWNHAQRQFLLDAADRLEPGNQAQNRRAWQSAGDGSSAQHPRPPGSRARPAMQRENIRAVLETSTVARGDGFMHGFTMEQVLRVMGAGSIEDRSLVTKVGMVLGELGYRRARRRVSGGKQERVWLFGGDDS